MQDSGSLAVFKVTARDQGHYKGPSEAFVTYCNISCFILIFLKSKVQQMLYTKFQPSKLCGSGEKVDCIGLASLRNSSHFLIFDQAEFHHSEALQPHHAACEI